MNKKDLLLTLAGIVERGSGNVTADDKIFIVQAAKELTGEDVVFERKKCNNCVIDKAVELYKVAKDEMKKTDAEVKNELQEIGSDKRKYHLPFGKVLNFYGSMITEQDLTDALAECIIAKGFPEDLFVITK